MMFEYNILHMQRDAAHMKDLVKTHSKVVIITKIATAWARD